jgi:hypothetical protein
MKSRLLFPFHISYGVILIDLDDALFNVNASISQTYPQNDSQRHHQSQHVQQDSITPVGKPISLERPRWVAENSELC